MSLLGPPAVRCHRIARWSRGVWAITAYEDLVELGHLDAAGLQLLFELARQEAHRFPSLAPPEGWTADALWDLAHDFFVDRGARVTTMLLAQASDEALIGRLLRRSLRNYLIAFFFFQAEDGIRHPLVTGVKTCALPISPKGHARTEQAGGRKEQEGWRGLSG